MPNSVAPIRLRAVHSLNAQAEATPTRSPDQPWDWTPPPIPQPLPAPGGPIVEVKGKSPARPAPPSNVESPSTGGTPGAEATPPVEFPATNPGNPPQPAATPVPSGAEVTAQAPAATVTLTPDFRFDPEEVTIQAGQVVQWTNAGRAPQTVTANPIYARDKSHAELPDGAEAFNSGIVNAGASFSHTFETPGAYAYFSIPQEDAGMLGRVIVQ